MDQRIDELESRLAFQDDVIETLNGVVTRQQLQLDNLEKEVLLLKQQIKNLSPSQIADESEETPPPHY